MKTSMKLFLPAAVLLCSLWACQGLLNDDSGKVPEEEKEENIADEIIGTWEVIHISGYEQQWNDELKKDEIVPTDRDVTPLRNDEWSVRVTLHDERMTFYRYLGADRWVVWSQNSYSISGNKVSARNENGPIEMTILTVEENKVVFEMPLDSDKTKAMKLTVKRVNGNPSGGENPNGITEEQIMRHINGTWEVIHASGYEGKWNEELNAYEAVPVDRDVLVSEDDGCCQREEYQDGEVTIYWFNGSGWEVASNKYFSYSGKYLLEGNNITQRFTDGTRTVQVYITVISIGENELVYDMMLVNVDVSKSSRLTFKRVDRN